MEWEYTGVDILEALESAENYNDYLTRLIRERSDSTDLVDFGAGLGTFAKRLRNAGSRVVCIEPDPQQQQELIREGFETLADLSPLPDGSVPFVFSLNVFEHIRDDGAALEQIYRKLAPGGLVLIYVPAFQCLWSSLDDKVCHFRRYTKGTLRRLVLREKFAIEQLRYVDCLGFVAAMVFRVLGKTPDTLNSASISIYDRWIFPLSRILDLVLHRFVGKNVFVVCRK